MDQARAYRIIRLLWGDRGLAEAARQLSRVSRSTVTRQNIYQMVRHPGGKVTARLAVFLRMSVRVRVLQRRLDRRHATALRSGTAPGAALLSRHGR